MKTGANVAETILISGILVLGIALLIGTQARAEDKCPEAACLSWAAPNQYESGAPLPASELAGFKIYVYAGESRPDCAIITKNYKFVVTTSPTERAHTINLPDGAYFFAVTAVDTNNRESTCSNIEGKTISRRFALNRLSQ